ncbi:MAG: DNA methyltransferase [Galactobacter sp.]
MASFDSIVIGEDFVSEHFFTTDAKKESFLAEVLKRRKVWDEDEAAGHDSVRTSFASARGKLIEALSALEEAPSDDTIATSADLLRTSLGFAPTSGHDVTLQRGTRELNVPNATRSGVLLHLTAHPAGSPDDILARLDSDDERPNAGRPLGTVTEVGTDKAQTYSTAELVSEAFLSDDAPSWVMVTAGRWILITQAEKWPLGKWIAADALLVAERAGNEKAKGKELDHFLAVMAADAFKATGEGELWWDTVLEGSVKHAVGVSSDLRQGIRESIEIIANDVLRRRLDVYTDTYNDSYGVGGGNDNIDGNELAKQSLRFLYRILFLLYAEASPEMGVLPVGDDVYDAGYGLDRLRDLTLVELDGDRELNGTHLYLSLARLFELVDQGHTPQGSGEGAAPDGALGAEMPDGAEPAGDSLTFRSLKADLFRPAATALIDEVQLSNEAVQKVLQLLLLTKQKNKKDRGYISYAELGINQLGSVYEGLMSFTGFIAKEELREVAKNGDASKGSWVVPASQAESIDPKHFVTEHDPVTGYTRPRSYKSGEFVYRLAGRERQQSASYYSPEVITKFVVSQALAELLDQPEDGASGSEKDGEGNEHITTAEEILNLTVCEPALGSGAFAIEAVRQLAAEYLTRRQKELGEEIPADEYPRELQKVKAHIALHQIHGVDLNATAVELAEVSLWLDTMVPGLQAPWFGLRLRRGNSLIGARRSLYRVDQVRTKTWLKETPVDAPLTGLAEAMRHDAQDPFTEGKIHHFLLPSEGWGAAADAKEVKDLVPDAQKALKDWRKGVRLKPNKDQIAKLQNLSRRVETLWAFALRRLQVAANQSSRYVDFFGREGLNLEGGAGAAGDADEEVVTRDEIEASLADANGAYRRLRRVMDAWTALWFWPLTDESIKVRGEFGQTEFATPPSMDEWIATCEALLGSPIPDSQFKGKTRKYETAGQSSFLSQANWEELGGAEELDRSLSGQVAVQTALKKFPWLQVAERVAADQGFFHWDLDFAGVFARGGFDLQVGNPPWVRPDWDETATFAEFDPWWQVEDRTTQAERNERKAQALANQDFVEFMVGTAGDIVSTREFLTGIDTAPVTHGLRPDLYRSFMEIVWRHGSPTGVQSLVHPESHFTEKKAGSLRAETYRRLRRHWQFINEFKLYEIDHHVSYGVHVYGHSSEQPRFVNASSLFHPRTVEESFHHDGSGNAPRIKDEEGHWDTRPHRDRLLHVDGSTLQVWGGLLDDEGTPPIQARMVYVVNTASERVLEKLAAAPRVRELGLQFSSGWNETTDRKKGYFEVGSAVPDSWDDVILQGGWRFGVCNPFAADGTGSAKNNLDRIEIDLESLSSTYLPHTAFQYVVEPSDRIAGMRKLEGQPEVEFPRLTWREWISLTGARTLQVAVLPPGPAHTFNFMSMFGNISTRRLYSICGAWSSLITDSLVRSRGSSHLQPSVMSSFPVPTPSVYAEELADRAEKLCLAPPFRELFGQECVSVIGYESNALKRQILTSEADSLAALAFGIGIDDLISLYRTDFGVLQKSDRSTLYDANGRKVPNEHKKDAQAGEEFRWTHPQSGVEYLFQPPYAPFDREQAMRDAYAELKPLADADTLDADRPAETDKPEEDVTA